MTAMIRQTGDQEAEEPPKPPKNGINQSTYALGIWEEGQTLYRYEEHPLDSSRSSWTQIDHFSHGDDEIQNVYFDQATAKPELNEDNVLVAVWLYTQGLSSGPSQSRRVTAESDRSRSRRQIGEDDEERALGDIGGDTAFHRALAVVDDLTDGEKDAVSVKEISERGTDPEGTVYSAMTKLWERKLVEREDRSRGGGRSRKAYWLSPYGEQVLADLGRPDSE